MAEEIKELIAKIQEEGIKAAEEKAREIQSQAKKEAERIISQAKIEAKSMLSQAEDKIQKLQDASSASLSQAGRNLLISLRKELNTLLDKVIILAVRQALSPNELAKILHTLITETTKQDRSNIVISLNKEDWEKLEKNFWAELKEELKKGITIKASDDVLSGFIISYDSGKSYFDFTDKALADYLGQYLRPELAKILKTD